MQGMQHEEEVFWFPSSRLGTNGNSKLRFVEQPVDEAIVSGGSAKQSFAAVWSQAGAWDRETEKHRPTQTSCVAVAVQACYLATPREN
jgi:hypothetical protein